MTLQFWLHRDIIASTNMTEYKKKAGAIMDSVYQQLAALLREAVVINDNDELSLEQLCVLLEKLRGELAEHKR